MSLFMHWLQWLWICWLKLAPWCEIQYNSIDISVYGKNERLFIFQMLVRVSDFPWYTFFFFFSVPFSLRPGQVNFNSDCYFPKFSLYFPNRFRGNIKVDISNVLVSVLQSLSETQVYAQRTIYNYCGPSGTHLKHTIAENNV